MILREYLYKTSRGDSVWRVGIAPAFRILRPAQVSGADLKPGCS